MIKIFLSVLLFAFSFASPQEASLQLSQASIKVEGTSNIKKWDMNTEKAEGKAILKMEKGKIGQLTDLWIAIPAKSLVSGNVQMDKKAWKALKTDDFPIITYSLIKTINVRERANGQTIVAEGNLSIAGVSKKIIVGAESEILNGTIHFKGEVAVKMSDFGIDPPTALKGTLKTGDDIIVSFQVQFKSK